MYVNPFTKLSKIIKAIEKNNEDTFEQNKNEVSSSDDIEMKKIN